MALSKYANQRDTNEPDIITGLLQVGATVEVLDKPLDLLVGYRGQNFLLEVKLPKGPKGGTSHSQLNDTQKIFFRTWQGQRCVVRTLDDALLAIGATRKSEESGVHR